MPRSTDATTRVLLLEAHDDCRAAHAEALRVAGIDVVAVSDQQQALDAAPSVRPRVIVASFDALTRDDRLQFCRTLKADRRTKKTTVLLTTVEVGEPDVQLAMEAGALAVSIPPLDGAKLLSVVQGVLAAQRKPLPASLRGTDVSRSA